MAVILLKILKIIGIVLLSVLGLVLALVLLILLLPVRYRILAEKKENTTLRAGFRLTYFFWIFRAYADYSVDLTVRVKVLWFTLFELKLPEEKSSDLPEEKAMDELDQLLNELDEEDSAEPDAENADADTECEKTDDTEGIDTDDTKTDTDSAPDSIFDKIKFKLDEICDKIEKVRAEYRYYRNVINSNEAVCAIRNLKKRLLKILKKVFPRRVHADFVYGFDSPDLTGKVYGLYCIFRNRFDKSSSVTPDFDRQVFEGLVTAKGYFNLWSILLNLILIVLNPNSIRIYRSVKRHNGKKDVDKKEEKTAA